MKKLIVFISLILLLFSCVNNKNNIKEDRKSSNIVKKIEKLEHSNSGGGNGKPEKEQGIR